MPGSSADGRKGTSFCQARIEFINVNFTRVEKLQLIMIALSDSVFIGFKMSRIVTVRC